MGPWRSWRSWRSWRRYGFVGGDLDAEASGDRRSDGNASLSASACAMVDHASYGCRAIEVIKGIPDAEHGTLFERRPRAVRTLTRPGVRFW